MRAIHDHEAARVAPPNALTVEVLDGPGAGGACHLYRIGGFDTSSNSSCTREGGKPTDHAYVLFQNGPIPEKGANGVTHEALLAIVIDRLRSFQEGPFRCRENAIALTHLEEALLWLHHRTAARVARGVEGTSKV